jgi:WD40 repeat protein
MSPGAATASALRQLESTRSPAYGSPKRVCVLALFRRSRCLKVYWRQMEHKSAALFSGGHSDDVDYVSWNPTHPELFCTSSQKDRRIVFWDARRGCAPLMFRFQN